VAVEVALRVIDFDAAGVFDGRTEPLGDADSDPCVRFSRAPGELVGTSVAFADSVDVAVDLALPVELAVAVRVRFGDVLANVERDPLGDLDTLDDPLEEEVGVPRVPLKYSPAEPVGRGEREAWTEAEELTERDASADFDTLGEPLVVGLCVPTVTLVPLTLENAPGEDVGTSEGVEAGDGEARVDPETFADRLDNGERDTDGEPLTVVVSVPPVPLKAVSLTK